MIGFAEFIAKFITDIQMGKKSHKSRLTTRVTLTQFL